MNPWPSVGRMAMLRESSLGKTIVVLSLFLGPVGRRHVCSVAWRPHGLRIISSIVRNRDEVFGWFGTDRRGCSKRSGTLFRNVFRNKTEIFTALENFQTRTLQGLEKSSDRLSPRLHFHTFSAIGQVETTALPTSCASADPAPGITIDDDGEVSVSSSRGAAE